MLHLQLVLSLHTHSLSAPRFSPFNKRGSVFNRRIKYRSRGALDKDSEFELDPDKAREALKILDEQLKTLSQKQVTPPKIKAVDLENTRNQMLDDAPEISGSFLANLTFFLFFFTIFYNIFFLTVIKPAIEGPDEIPAATSVIEAPKAIVLQQLPGYQMLTPKLESMDIEK